MPGLANSVEQIERGLETYFDLISKTAENHHQYSDKVHLNRQTVLLGAEILIVS